MFNTRNLKVALATVVVGSALSQAAYAQGISTLRTPLIPGAQETAPIAPAAEGDPPPPGAGPTPVGVNPGMGGSPGFEPWVPAIPANTIDQSFTGIGLPVSPGVALPPGVLGPALTGIVPNSPSTPGAEPAYVYAPDGSPVASDVVQVQQGGGLPGTGGYNTTITKVRRGGQTTSQWEQRGLTSVLGGGGMSQDEVTLTGPLAGFGVPFGVPTGFGYNKGPAGSNNDLRLSAIDLGGGMRTAMGGTKISTGSTLQDYGLSATRNNGVTGLTAAQAFEFGQGRHREPIFSNTTTDFGLPFKQSTPPNVGYQKTGQLLNPKAIETNF